MIDFADEVKRNLAMGAETLAEAELEAEETVLLSNWLRCADLAQHYADALIEIAVRNGPRTLRDPVRAENPHYCTAARKLGIL